MSELTDSNIHKLQHMLGADSRYKKRQWGFRNNYMAGGLDFKEMDKMVDDGYLSAGRIRTRPEDLYKCRYYFATIKGAKAIGFKKYQLNKLKDL
tara:strand:- start:484 stop:765 length:282 start_codon:yes stop_codon:yes gene_type:complete